MHFRLVDRFERFRRGVAWSALIICRTTSSVRLKASENGLGIAERKRTEDLVDIDLLSRARLVVRDLCEAM